MKNSRKIMIKFMIVIVIASQFNRGKKEEEKNKKQKTKMKIQINTFKETRKEKKNGKKNHPFIHSPFHPLHLLGSSTSSPVPFGASSATAFTSSSPANLLSEHQRSGSSGSPPTTGRAGRPVMSMYDMSPPSQSPSSDRRRVKSSHYEEKIFFETDQYWKFLFFSFFIYF